MARVDCKVCNHGNREGIERIALRDGPRAAGRAAGCSHNAVMRHMAKHADRGSAVLDPADEELDEGDGLVEASGDTTSGPVGEAASEPPRAEEQPSPVASDVAAQAVTPARPARPLGPVPAPRKSSRREARFTALSGTLPAPGPGSADHKARYPKVAALVTLVERRAYLVELFRRGRFHGLRTTGLLSMIWDDLGPLEFSELVTSAAAELNFRRGSDQARRVVLVGILEKCVRMALAQEDPKTAARLAEVWAKIDGLTAEQDLQSAALKHEAMRLIAGALQRHPAALADVHATLAAADAQKRAALAPVTVAAEPDAAE